MENYAKIQIIEAKYDWFVRWGCAENMKSSARNIIIAILALLAPMFSACATLGGKTQAVAVDTEPRGLSVAVNSTLSDDDPLTPSAVNISRDQHLNLIFHADGFQKTDRINCHVRYGTVFGGNVPLGLLALSNPLTAALLYSSLVGIDFLTGSAYECPYIVHRVIDVPSTVTENLTESCQRILLLPPPTEGDLSLNYALMEEAKHFAKRSGDECVEFVSPSVATDALKRSSLTEIEIKQLFAPEMEKRWAQLLRDTGAHRAIELKFEERKRDIVSVKFTLWDLYSGQIVASFKKNFQKEKFEKLKGGWGSRFLGNSIKLIPNSVAFLRSSPNLNLESDFAAKQEQIGGKSTFFGLLTATTVQHPDQYESWDGDFQFGPSFYFDSIRNKVMPDDTYLTSDELAKIEPTALEARDFRAYALNIPLDAVLSLHTPAGAFRAFLGYGLGSYLPTSDSSEDTSLKLYGTTHFGADWVAYMSSNLFFQFGAHGFSRGDSAIERQGPHKLTGWNSIMLGVGYYFPGSQGYIESFLSKW